jgi:hypothetical protein
MKSKEVFMAYRNVNSPICYPQRSQMEKWVCVTFCSYACLHISHIGIDYATTQHYNRGMAISRGYFNWPKLPCSCIVCPNYILYSKTTHEKRRNKYVHKLRKMFGVLTTSITYHSTENFEWRHIRRHSSKGHRSFSGAAWCCRLLTGDPITDYIHVSWKSNTSTSVVTVTVVCIGL